MHNALQRSAMLCYSVTSVLLHARECSGGDSNSKFRRSLRRYEKGSRAGAGAAHGQRLDHYVRGCGEQLPRRPTLGTFTAGVPEAEIKALAPGDRHMTGTDPEIWETP